MQAWMRGWGCDVFADIIDSEMDILKENFKLPATDVTPQYVDNWSFESTIGCTTKQHAPILMQILMRAGQDKKAKERNKKKNPETVCSLYYLTCSISPFRFTGFPNHH